MPTLASPPELFLIYADASPTEIEQADTLWRLQNIGNRLPTRNFESRVAVDVASRNIFRFSRREIVRRQPSAAPTRKFLMDAG
jgi:hypothetical protein